MTKRFQIWLIAGLLLPVACSAPPPAANQESQDQLPPPGVWQELQPEQMDQNQQALVERALSAQQTMARQLKIALVAALDQGGPELAIAVCHEQAPRIAAEISESTGVRLGRTSFKLRSQANQSPPWAADLVARQVSEPVWLAGDRGLAGLLPIRLQPECEMCHGEPAAVAEEVRARIDQHYPDDQALGFTAGDLRGWFWVEVDHSR